MKRGALVLCALLVVSTLPVGLASGAVNVSVTDATVSPETPAPGDTVTVRPTIRNADSTDDFEVNAIAIRSTGKSLKEYTRIENVGTVAAGDSLTVPLTLSFDSPGERFLRVVVYGEGPGGQNKRVEYPVTIDVRRENPQFAVEAADTIVGTSTTVEATVANGLDYDLRNVELNLTTPDGVERRVAAGLPSGTERTYEFAVTPDNPGMKELEATLRYETNNGRQRVMTRTVTFEAEPFRRSVELDASPVGEGRTRAIQVGLSNRGNAPIENVTLSATSENATLSTVYLPEVSATAQRSVPLNVTAIDGEGRFEATVSATYETGEMTRTKTETVHLVSRPGRVRLTGLDVEEEAGSLHIVGSASNVGLTAANGVVVSVLPSETVQPAYPGKEYFVGTVPESDFVSFDVYADADANATVVPLEVSYVVDGREVVRRTEVDIPGGGAPAPEPSGGGDGGGMLGALAIGGVVLVAALGLMYVAWRNYRGDT